MIAYGARQRERILASLEDVRQPQAHTDTWKRRVYAPMLIHSDEFAHVRRQIEALYPDYVVAFDVIFESAGNATPWHCDYESLGPFEVADAFVAIRDAHFVSIHANMTAGGGALTTLDGWPRLSWVHYQTIVHTGIYSALHRALSRLCAPLFWLTARTASRDVG